MNLREFTNRGRLFDVEPTFPDIVSHEMHELVRKDWEFFNRMGFGNPQPEPAPGTPISRFTRADQEHLDVEQDRCDAEFDLGGEEYGVTLECHLDQGHVGTPHYDAGQRIEWMYR